MHRLPLTAEQANAVFDVLVTHLGVNPQDRSLFVCTHTREFVQSTPLMSVLPGATFQRSDEDAGRWHVSVPDGALSGFREQAASAANQALDALSVRLV